MTIIEQLKNNEKPYLFMENKLKEKLLTIPPKYVQCLAETSTVNVPKWLNMENRETNNFLELYCYNTYRLRQDYEESRWVECEVYEEDGSLYYNYCGCVRLLSSAVNNKNFIGYKYKDGTYSTTPTRLRHKKTANLLDNINSLSEVTVERCTHVIFERGE